MFRIGPVIDADDQQQEPEPVGEQRQRVDPYADLDPFNPPHPRSRLGKAVIKRNNQLRKMYIGRRRVNEGYHHDSSPSSAGSHLTSDEDFNSHLGLVRRLDPEDKPIVQAAIRMRFNRDFPTLHGGMDTPPPEAPPDDDQDEDRHDDPDAGEEAE
eukprot:3741612-Amphidinium_carterae.1